MPDPASPPFIHLRVCSAYSPLEGAIRIPEIVDLCQKSEMPAVGLADSDNLFGALDFASSMEAAGIQPIMGCAVGFGEPTGGISPALALYAQTETGWRNLLRLVSDLYLSDLYLKEGSVYVTLDRLAAAGEDLICLTGGAFGPLGALLRGRREAAAGALLDDLAAIFPDRLYVEIQRHGTGGERTAPAEAATEADFLRLAYDRKLPLVATNRVCFPDRDFFEAHEVLLAIGKHGEAGRYTPECCFTSSAEMQERFADLPEALANTVEIAQRCSFWPGRQEPQLPRFAEDEIEALRGAAGEGLEERIREIELVDDPSVYEARLKYELEMIEEMGFAGYFLIVADIIRWTRGQGIPVGPGRGSGAGSLVAYALRITDLDPIRYGLLFERFLNPERVSMPDFDIDFCERRRDEVIAYVRERYGAERTAKIISLGSLKSRASIRDVGRVLGMSYGETDRLAKLIPLQQSEPVRLADAMAQIPEFRTAIRADDRTQRLYEIARRIEGLTRNVSIHAAGLVIANRAITEMVPLYQDFRSDMPATQYTKEWVEEAGLVKFDLLGLKTLTAIQGAVDFLHARGVEFDPARVPLDDVRTFDLYREAETTGVFQVESEGMRSALRDLQPDRFEDLIALVALYRPGPMENIPSFCDRKLGRKRLEPISSAPEVEALLDPILKETYGIIVYQEQIMEIAQKLAGFSLGQADNLRRAIGKKQASEIQAMKQAFIAGMGETCGVEPAEAKPIYDLIEKFADYGFNKSHAAAYALISYQTAYLKVHHPVECLAAAMNMEIGGHAQDEKLLAYRSEARRLGITVPPPCVNHSGARFCPAGNSIPYALGAVKGVGVVAVGQIEEAHKAGGPYASLCDLARRVSLKSIGRGALEKLAAAGAFDALEPNRRRVLEFLPTLMAYSQTWRPGAEGGAPSLFGGEQLEVPEPPPPAVPDFPPKDRFAMEREAVGFLISGHPLDAYAEDLQAQNIRYCSEIAADSPGEGNRLVAGVVTQVQRRRSQRGRIYARLQISDPLGDQSLTMFESELERCRDALVEGASVVLEVGGGDGRNSRRGGGLICWNAYSLEETLTRRGRTPPDLLRLSISSAAAADTVAAFLRVTEEEGTIGSARIRLLLEIPEAESRVELAIPGIHPLTVSRRAELAGLPGILGMEVESGARAS